MTERHDFESVAPDHIAGNGSARRRDNDGRSLTTIHPCRRLRLETASGNLSMRILDLVAPIGFGQRGLLVAPPRTGKTVLLQQIAHSILANYPDSHLFVLLIDERPEEVTDMRARVRGDRADVFSSTFDRDAADHLRVAQAVLERGRRLAAGGADAIVLLDSLTRLARASNVMIPGNVRLGSGGLAAGALDWPKRFFGAARQYEESGSLTILASALIETGSRMDDVIFEEFKGTGNMELHLDRRVADRRVFPALDVNRSGTRREELLLAPDELARIWMLRKLLSELRPAEAIELLSSRLGKSACNAEFLKSIRLS